MQERVIHPDTPTGQTSFLRESKGGPRACVRACVARARARACVLTVLFLFFLTFIKVCCSYAVEQWTGAVLFIVARYPGDTSAFSSAGEDRLVYFSECVFCFVFLGLLPLLAAVVHNLCMYSVYYYVARE